MNATNGRVSKRAREQERHQQRAAASSRIDLLRDPRHPMFALDGVGANDNSYNPNYTDDHINDEQRNDVYHE